MSTKKSLAKNERKEIIILCLLLFIAWRIWLQAFLWLGWLVLPLGENFLGGGLRHFLEHPGLWPWANFDGEHYLSIAHHGYGNFEQAFFPFFPFLIKSLVLSLKGSPFALLLSGLTISHLSVFFVLITLFLLVKLDFDKKTALWTLVFLLAFPTSFFFVSVYSEALFLAFILGSFYFARKGRWWLAGILGMFASATRFTGIFLLPALLWEGWEQNKNIKYLKSLIPIFLVPIGLLWYMRSLAVNYGDPLMFIHAQPVFGAQREVDKIILPYQVLWRYFKMILETRIDPLFFTVWLELTTTLGFLALLIFGYLKKVRISYLLFAFLSYIVPTLTGTFSSMPRYVLVLFPGFIALALIKNSAVRWLLLGISIALLAVSTIFFTRGYFIS